MLLILVLTNLHLSKLGRFVHHCSARSSNVDNAIISKIYYHFNFFGAQKQGMGVFLARG